MEESEVNMWERIIGELDHAMQDLARNFEHFVPRLLAMLIIALLGWVVAYVLKVGVRGILRVVKFDKLSDNAGATQLLNKLALPSSSELLSRVVFWMAWMGFILLGVEVLEIVGLHQAVRGDVHYLFRIGSGQFFFKGRFTGSRQCRLPIARATSNFDPDNHCYFRSDHGLRAAWPRREDNSGGLRDCFRGVDAWPCHCVWHGRPRLGKAVSGKTIPKRKGRTKTRRTLAAVTLNQKGV
jgi:hypothetical protein